MIASLLLSFIAGMLTVRAEPLVRSLVERADVAEFEIGPLDVRVLSFGLLLLVASVLTALLGADSSAYMAAAGGLLGYFAAIVLKIARRPDPEVQSRGSAREDINWDVPDAAMATAPDVEAELDTTYTDTAASWEETAESDLTPRHADPDKEPQR